MRCRPGCQDGTSRRILSSPAVVLQATGTRAPLFILGGAAGGAFGFSGLVARLGADRPVYGLKRADASTSYATIEEIAAFYVRQMRRIRPDGPYCVTGFSLGGYLTCEVARQLSLGGQRVGLTAILDADCPLAAEPRFLQAVLAVYGSLRNLPFFLVDDALQDSFAAGVARGYRALRRRLLARFPRWFGYDAANKADSSRRWESDVSAWPESLRRAYALQVEALHHYRPRPFDGRVHLFRTRARPFFTTWRGADLGWKQVALGGVDVTIVPGNHATMMQEPHVAVLAQELKAALDRVPD